MGESNMKNLILSSVLVLIAASAAQAQQAVQWKVSNGGNGHWYRLVSAPTVSWASAASAAGITGGHLATLTASPENNFVVATFQGFPSRYPWIGLIQDPNGSEPAGGWGWVTNEPLTWANWSPSEPNGDFPYDADQANLWLVAEPGRPLGTWNDWTTGGPDGYLVEWSADCNADGIVDYGQCRDGSLPDYNSNNVPDCCESGTDCLPNLLINGGFELGPVQTDCTWVVHDTSSAFVPGWSVVAVSVDRERLSATCPIGTESWTSFAGEFTIDLDGGSAGGAVAQTVATQVGRSYRLSFQLTGNCTTGDKPMSVEIGSSFWAFVHSCQATNPQPWSEKSVEFVATGPTTTVVLRSLMTDGRNGPVVDAVRLEEVVRNCEGDIDDSGAVNGVDLSIILNSWGSAGGKYPAADVNGDGVVDGADLATVLSGWGPCPN
jgi:hypothetical protein